MRIITKGKLPSDKEATVKCHNCSTTFACTRADGTFMPDQRDGDSINVKCPLCQVSIFIDVRKFI